MTQTIRCLLAAIPITLLLAACARPAPSPLPPAAANVLVVAHRGGAALAPENTLGAFSAALALGVDMIECDVHLSHDGELVVMHDPDLTRTTDGSGLVSSLTMAELKKLNAASKFAGGTWPAVEPIPTLGEVLDVAKGKALVQIEIKASKFPGRYPGIEQKVIDAVKARDMLDQVIIISFDFPTLVDVKKLEPTVKTGALVNASWMTERLLKSPEQIVDDAMQNTGADYFLPVAGNVSQDLVSAVHAKGLRIGTWTVDAPGDMQRLAGFGIDAITTNKPDELKRVLGK
ncbi:MAG TPA: glycerophosphodiester phosphodiesterase family protein [Anaerolineae bacterium]|nr:glycerophosphodiester phosphodiesterase family protein [Anaerolineae bacterium]HOQ98796.1 glycerophosphodiester phosphodiesterase family protein [Anaerolineae bacterium]HPL26979.1 glycerophosphodiester phosphodiesterase family protein [Anaerolineae bacterium]